jgi:acyl-CoA thioesterase-1
MASSHTCAPDSRALDKAGEMAPPLSRLSRRACLAAVLGLAAGPAIAGPSPVVTLLGDSITAGYGLPAADALPARLQAELARLGARVTVRAAGVSGDTTADGLARLDFSVQADTRLCIVALGGNDLLQGLDPKATRANLERIVSRLKSRHIRIVLTGQSAPRAIGAGYAREFDAVFPAVARGAGIALYPDLLAGVARIPTLNQPDGIHPNAAGVSIIAARLAPLVARSLRSAR